MINKYLHIVKKLSFTHNCLNIYGEASIWWSTENNLYMLYLPTIKYCKALTPQLYRNVINILIKTNFDPYPARIEMISLCYWFRAIRAV